MLSVQISNPASTSQRSKDNRMANRRKSRSLACGCGCVPLLIFAVALGLIAAIYFFSPGRSNILILGIDQAPPGSAAGRSDTNILVTVIPSRPYIGMLSIPRDLWIDIPRVGQNRINTAHFFAEASSPGSGPAAAMQTVRENFGVDVDHFIRIQFEGFKDVFNAMGGVDIELTEPTAGYEPGKHHLTGRKALAFARNRSGSDDFFRMNQGQLILKAGFKQMLSPLNWYRIPAVLAATFQAIDTDIPAWQWPRLAFTLLRLGADGVDYRTIGREMVVPTTTAEGASVLLPKWEIINPVLLEQFGQ